MTAPTPVATAHAQAFAPPEATGRRNLIGLTREELTEAVTQLGEPAFRAWVLDSLSGALGLEPWRLVAPMFLHMSFMHLIFNMSWVSGLGGLIERERGSRLLLAVVLVTHVVSAFTEYFWQLYGLNDHVIRFGGFSGAVYGLIGFCWAYAEYNPRGYIRLSGQSIQLALIWMVLCFTGVLGPVANGAHLGGLVAGLMMGWLVGLRDARLA